MSNMPYIVQQDGITVFINKKPHHVKSSSKNYKKLKEALKNKEWDKVENLVSYGTAISTFSKGKLTLKEGVVEYDNKPLPKTLSKRIVSIIEEEMDLDPLIEFVERLKKNPSFNSVNQTYNFLETNMLPITNDGYVLAYKVVKFARHDDNDGKFKRGDLVDCHTGTIRNNVGDIVEMDRNEVDDDPTNLCSFGLHGGSEGYYTQLRHSPDNVMMVIKVDPKDIVAVPKYHDQSKFRCCKYEVYSYYGNDGDKKLEDEIVAHEGKTESFDSTVDPRKIVQQALDYAKTMVSYSRQRLSYKPGHHSAVAGWAGYLQTATFDKGYTQSQVANAVQAKTGFLTIKFENDNLYIVPA